MTANETATLMRRAAERIEASADRAATADPTGDRWEDDKVYDEYHNVWPLYMGDDDAPRRTGVVYRPVGSDWQYPEDLTGSGGIRVNSGFASHIALWDPPPARTVARLLRAMADFVDHNAERDVPTVFVAEFERLAREILRESP